MEYDWTIWLIPIGIAGGVLYFIETCFTIIEGLIKLAAAGIQKIRSISCDHPAHAAEVRKDEQGQVMWCGNCRADLGALNRDGKRVVDPMSELPKKRWPQGPPERDSVGEDV